MKQYGINIVPECLGMTRTLMLPPHMRKAAEEQLEPYDPKRHNTKIIIAEPMKCGLEAAQ